MANRRPSKVQGSTLHIAHSTSRKGFTLIEVLVAMSIFSIAVLGLAAGATSVMRANQTSYHNTIATNLAQDKLEELKAKTPSNIIAGGPITDIVDSVTFTRNWTVTVGSPVPGVKRIDVTVTWNDYTNHSLTISSAVKE